MNTDDKPWYDDRVKTLYSADDSSCPWDNSPDDPGIDGTPPSTPKEIYDYLHGLVWKQEEAKRAASIIMYQCLRRIKTNALFTGPTGSGKTHVWRCLRKLYPGRIEIVDASNITQDGWRGDKKWLSLLASPIVYSGENVVLVLDEADKMLAPKYSAQGENVSHGVQSEGLTMLEGTCVMIKDGPVTHEVDTNRISFVLCGAFSTKAHAVAEQDSPLRIGFGADLDAAASQPYAKPLTEADLLDYGVMPEFLGRIHRIVNLERMDAADYFRMTRNSGVVLHRLQEQYRADIRLTAQKRWELAAEAAKSGLGVRAMEARIRRLLDDAIFEDCQRRAFEF